MRLIIPGFVGSSDWLTEGATARKRTVRHELGGRGTGNWRIADEPVATVGGGAVADGGSQAEEVRATFQLQIKRDVQARLSQAQSRLEQARWQQAQTEAAQEEAAAALRRLKAEAEELARRGWL